MSVTFLCAGGKVGFGRRWGRVVVVGLAKGLKIELGPERGRRVDDEGRDGGAESWC